MNIGKKRISLLTVFCLTLSLVPTVAQKLRSMVEQSILYRMDQAK